MLKELPNHPTILAAQTGHCLEKPLLIIINFGSLAIFHDMFAPCCSMRSFISSVQQDFNSSLLTAASHLDCATPTLQPKHHWPAEENERYWKSLEGNFHFNCKASVSWTVVGVCVCKAQLGETPQQLGSGRQSHYLNLWVFH